jgi:hypothetical protein
MPSEKVNCPSCGGPAIKEGNIITCENCDAEFTFTKTGEAKIKDIGRLKTLEERVDHHEDLLQGLISEPDPAKLEPDPAKKEPDPNDEDSILG